MADPPRVDQSGTCAPALITYDMYKRTGEPGYKKLTDRVLDYIRHEPRVMVFLCSPAADYINGFTLAVDGGWLAR